MNDDGSLGILIPDKASGEAFCQAFAASSSIPFSQHYAIIRPRVIANRLNPDPGVAKDLAAALLAMYQEGNHLILIACNTLQLWLDTAFSQLPKKVAADLTVITTLDAILWHLGKDKGVIWLGTSVFVKRLTELGFTTLITKNLPQLQDQLQEIIWRTKAVDGMDHSTAGNIANLSDKNELIRQTNQFIQQVTEQGINRVVLGCTELPLALLLVPHPQLQTINPAEILAHYLDHFLNQPVTEL